MDFARKLPAPEIGDGVRGEIDRVQTAWRTALARYGSNGGFLFGRFSIADCMYAPVVSRFLTYSIPMSDEVMVYAKRIADLPAMKEWGIASQQEIDSGLPDQWVVDNAHNT